MFHSLFDSHHRRWERVTSRLVAALAVMALAPAAWGQARLWSNTLGSTSAEQGQSVAMDSTGMFFASGFTSAPFTNPSTPYDQDVLVYKYTSTGTSPAASYRLVAGNSVQTVKDSIYKNGTLYVLYTSTSTFFPTMGQKSLGVAVFDSNLNLNTTRSCLYRHASQDTEGVAITVDANDNIYVTGTVMVPNENLDVLVVKNPRPSAAPDWTDTERGPGFLPYYRRDVPVDLVTDATHLYVGAQLQGSASPYATYQAVLKYPLAGSTSPGIYAHWQTGFEGTSALSMAYYNNQVFITGGSLPNASNPNPYPSCVTIGVNTSSMTLAWSFAYAFAGASSYGSAGKHVVAGPGGVFVSGDAHVNGSPMGPQPTAFLLNATSGGPSLVYSDGQTQATRAMAGHSTGRLLLAGGPTGMASAARALHVLGGVGVEDLLNGTGNDFDYYSACAFDPTTAQSVAVGTIRTATVVPNPSGGTMTVYHDDFLVSKFAAQ